MTFLISFAILLVILERKKLSLDKVKKKKVSHFFLSQSDLYMSDVTYQGLANVNLVASNISNKEFYIYIGDIVESINQGGSNWNCALRISLMANNFLKCFPLIRINSI